jgi:hypothetical protein
MPIIICEKLFKLAKAVARVCHNKELFILLNLACHIFIKIDWLAKETISV